VDDDNIYCGRVREKKFFDSDFRYATLMIRPGLDWPFSSTDPKSSTPDIVAAKLRRTASGIKGCA
jgi:hypothetical protein